jgi:hypothetical protein
MLCTKHPAAAMKMPNSIGGPQRSETDSNVWEHHKNQPKRHQRRAPTKDGAEEAHLKVGRTVGSTEPVVAPLAQGFGGKMVPTLLKMVLMSTKTLPPPSVASWPL